MFTLHHQSDLDEMDVKCAIPAQKAGNSGHSCPGRRHCSCSSRQQRAPSVTGPWSTIDTQTASPSGLIEYHDTPPPPGQAFYRTVQP
jgi:hypothetical protein